MLKGGRGSSKLKVGVKCINVTLSHPIELKTRQHKKSIQLWVRENGFLMGQFMGRVDGV